MGEANIEEEQTAIQRVIDLVIDIAKGFNETTNLPKCPIGAMVLITFKNRMIAVTNYGHVTPRDLALALLSKDTQRAQRKLQAEMSVGE